MIQDIIKLIEAGLRLWTLKEADKYRAQLLDLRKRYWDEYNKPEAERSDAVLDQLVFDIRLLGSTFVSAAATGAGASDTPTQH